MEMEYTDVEKEVIFLSAVHELIDGMVNPEILEIRGEYSNHTVHFKSKTHQKYFYILLVEL